MNCARDNSDQWLETKRGAGRLALAGLLAGLCLPLLGSGLTGPAWIACALILAVVAASCRWFGLALLLAGAAWTSLHLLEGLSQRALFSSPAEATVTGRVVGTPVDRGDLLEFRFAPADGQLEGRLRSPVLLVRWYRDYPELNSGEVWHLQLQLKPARSRLNFQGSDRERWYFAQDIAALATVRQGRPLESAGTAGAPLRERVRARFNQVLDEHPARGMVLALAVADRSEMDDAAWSRYRLTGTSHLLAISGLHVGLAALLGFGIGRLLMLASPVAAALRLGLYLPWVLSLGCAAWYAYMAGFGTSTRRALLMLTVLAAATLLARQIPPLRALSVALALVLLVNPLAPLGAGFWLSFLAVGVLVLLFSPRHAHSGKIRSLLLAQAGLALVLAPVTLAWFQQLPALGGLANLLAIPWVSVAVAPPAILATFLALLDWPPAHFPMFFAAEAAQLLEWLLVQAEVLARRTAVYAPGAGFWVTVLGTLGAACWLLPRGIPQRFAGGLLLLPLLLPAWPRRDELLLEMLDVGQGLAVLVRTRETLVLYDSGPGDARSWSMVPGVVAQAVTAAGRRAPDRVILSHRDLDHAGGIHELRRRYPGARYLSGGAQPLPGFEACVAPVHWQSGYAQFRVLHPSTGLPYLGNDSSCVVSITFGETKVLLSGDIGSTIEQRLLQQGLTPHGVLLVPHHGSRSSSSQRFVEGVNPDVALVSAAHGNRFGFPHQEVGLRYQQQQTVLLGSAECGAVRLRITTAGAIEARSARRQLRAPWHWPPGADCP